MVQAITEYGRKTEVLQYTSKNYTGPLMKDMIGLETVMTPEFRGYGVNGARVGQL